MKRSLIAIVAVLALSASLAMAQEAPAAATEGYPAATARRSALAIDVGAGLAWSQRYSTGVWFIDLPFGFRGGFWGDLMYRASDVLELGAEAGVYYMQWDDQAGVTVFLGDFPVCLKVSIELGAVSLDALAGAMLAIDYSDGIYFNPGMMAGTRLFIGQVFAEADYVLRFTQATSGERKAYPRFALGYKLPIK